MPSWEKFPVKVLRAKDAEEAMFRSYEMSSLNTILWSVIFALVYTGEWKLALLNAIGIGLAVAFNPLTSYFTSYKKRPVKRIVESTKTGTATTVLSGLSVGMESSVWSVMIICLALASSFLIYQGMPPIYMLYGVAMSWVNIASSSPVMVSVWRFPIRQAADGRLRRALSRPYALSRPKNRASSI